MFGICLQYVWNMCEICMEYVWNVCGMCVEYLWNVCGICLEYVNICEYVWNMCGMCVAYVWNMCGICVALCGSVGVCVCLWLSVVVCWGLYVPPYRMQHGQMLVKVGTCFWYSFMWDKVDSPYTTQHCYCDTVLGKECHDI